MTMPGSDTIVSPSGPLAREGDEDRSGVEIPVDRADRRDVLTDDPGAGNGAGSSNGAAGDLRTAGSDVSRDKASRDRASRDRASRNNAADHKVAGDQSSRDEGAAGEAATSADGSDQPNGAEPASVGRAAPGPFAKRPSKRGRRRRRRAASSAEAPPSEKPVALRKARRPVPRGPAAEAPLAGATVPAEEAAEKPVRSPPPSRPAVQAGRANRPAPAYAALDLGTNNCRLLVAIPGRPGAFRVVDAFSRIVRLGEGLGATGRLSDEAMDRAVEALAVCRDKLIARPVERTRLIATEACRSADNGAAFLERVHRETGLRLEVVDRQTEARLAVAGCGSLVDRTARSTVLFDIGGGSSEIAVIDLDRGGGRNLSDNIVGWTSLPIGVVTLAERFGGTHVDPQSFAAMVAHAEDLLADFAARHRRAGGGRDDAFHLIGTSGTVTTLAGIHLGLKRYDRRRVDGLWMADHEVDRINDQLLSWSFDERVANPCIGRDRADLVLAGCAILQAIRNIWPARRLRVADRGLREGLLTEMMAADGAWRRSRYRRGRGRRQAGPNNGAS